MLALAIAASAVTSARRAERRADVAAKRAELTDRVVATTGAEQESSVPDHQWKDGRLRFRKPDGTWGKWMDLRGFPGISVMGPSGQDGTAGLTQAQVIALIAEYAPAGGGSSGDGTSVSAVTDDDVLPGQPLFAKRTGGHFALADATTQERSTCVGLAGSVTAAGFIAIAQEQQLTLADWSAVTGTALLTPGAPYFLTIGAGILSTDAPLSGFIAQIGTAATATTMRIEPQPTIEI